MERIVLELNDINSSVSSGVLLCQSNARHHVAAWRLATRAISQEAAQVDGCVRLHPGFHTPLPYAYVDRLPSHLSGQNCE